MSTDRPYIAWDEGADRLVVSLPHHCGEWDIGGPDEVREMIQALSHLLPKFEQPDVYRHPHPCPRCGKVCYFSGNRCAGIIGRFPGCGGGGVCTACFYPAQAERRAACQAAHHPKWPCEMVWCTTCLQCQRGCRCERAGRTFGPPVER